MQEGIRGCPRYSLGTHCPVWGYTLVFVAMFKTAQYFCRGNIRFPRRCAHIACLRSFPFRARGARALPVSWRFDREVP